MTRFFGIFGVIAFSLALIFTLGSLAGDPPEGLKPLKKLDSGEDKKTAEPGLKKLDQGGDKLKKPGVQDPKEGEEDPLEKLKPLNKKEQEKPKLELPTQPLKKKGQQEDPKEVIARVAKNMEASEDNLKKHKTGEDTQKIQQKIVEDLDKLINQEPPKKPKSGGAKKNKTQTQKDQQSPKDQKNQQNKPDNQPQTTKNQQKKPDDPMNMKDPMDLAKKGEDKDKGGKNTKPGDGKKDDPTSKNTIAATVKDPWGNLSKAKRLELDAYANEPFMPQYEQLLRQYYQTVAEQSGKKKGD